MSKSVIVKTYAVSLESSADYFGYPLDRKQVMRKLDELSEKLPSVPHKVRLLVARDGVITVESEQIQTPADGTPMQVVMAREPMDRRNPFLYHKTTNRKGYADASAANPGYFDVILWNDEDEVTESTRANVVAEIDGVLCTPPVSCGLLAGTYRAQLIETGEVVERIIAVDELLRSPRVLLVNSVRGRMPVTVVRSPSGLMQNP